MLRRLSLLVKLFMFISLVAGTLLPGARPLAAQDCTDDAEIVAQELDPDSENLAPGSDFTVTWEVRNTGDCAWSRTYRLLFVEGDRMDGARTVRVRSQVDEAETVSFTLELLAPDEAGTYRGSWQLRNGDGDNFGPLLTVAIVVGEGEIGTTEVVLPEVMAFGGMGGGGDAEALLMCLENGALPAAPTMFVDYEALVYRYTVLYLCSLPEGAEVFVEVTDPLGNTFTRSYVEDAPVVGYDNDGNEYFGTVLTVNLTWLAQAPDGVWGVVVASESLSYDFTLDIQPVAPSEFDTMDYPQLDNVPVGPIDPFAASGGCHYIYAPGAEMTLTGENFTPNETLQLGFYQERAGNAYLLGQEVVESDEEGRFSLLHTAPQEPGGYHLVAVRELTAAGYLDDETQYMFGNEESGTSCYTVQLAEEPEFPLRMAYVTLWQGEGGAEVQALDMATGWEFRLSDSYNCDASEPDWWPDGEWVVYQTTCRRELVDGFYQTVPADDYDLVATMLDFTYMLPEEERRSVLTVTPDVDETEPDVNADGLIVYRKTAVGEELETSGELWILDVFNATDEPLGLVGRAPTWSPDGTQIAFMSDVEGRWQIYLYDLADEELTLLSEGCAGHCMMPAWSPNNRQVIYQGSASPDDETSAGLWIVNASGLGRPRLFLAGEYSHPTWSAEGWVAFAGPAGLYRATTGREPEVTRYLYSDPTLGTLVLPVWSQ